jgi:glycosyltransferase involved in cell wall biosynthesis
VPVVSTNAGGIPELNVQGVTGMLSNIGDVEDMVKNALYVLDDDNLPRFKAAALARAQEFAVGSIVPLYEQCYERAMQLALQSAG